MKKHQIAVDEIQAKVFGSKIDFPDIVRYSQYYSIIDLADDDLITKGMAVALLGDGTGVPTVSTPLPQDLPAGTTGPQTIPVPSGYSIYRVNLYVLNTPAIMDNARIVGYDISGNNVIVDTQGEHCQLVFF